MKKILAISLILILLTGCSGSQPLKEYDFTPETSSAFTENRDEELTATQGEGETATQVERPQRVYATYPTTDSNIRYHSGARVSYYDVDLRRNVTLCSQPNCKHSDESCKAYLGQGVRSYHVVGDWAYALQDNSREFGSCLLLRQNYVTGERQILVDLTPPEGYSIEYPGFSFVGDDIFYMYDTYTLDPEAPFGYQYADNKRFTCRYDMETGESELIMEEPIQPVTRFVERELKMGLSTEKFWVMIRMDLPENPKQNEDGNIEYGGEVIDWGDYMEEIRKAYPARAYSVNLETGEETFLFYYGQANMQDGACYVDKGCSYVVDNTLCIYDGYTGEVRQCFYQENIGWQGYMDGRIFYNYHNGDPHRGNYRFYWYDLTTGEKQEFNQGYDSFAFGLDGETADYFYSTYGYNGKHWISKQDFYNENYGNAF